MEKRRRWIKLWINESLRGSIRIELTPAERSVWYDLLLMAGESRHPGVIEARAGKGYSLGTIAAWLIIPVELLKSTLDKCLEEGRIQINSGCIHIVNWDKYQAGYESQKSYRESKKLKTTSVDPYLKQKYGDIIKE